RYEAAGYRVQNKGQLGAGLKKLAEFAGVPWTPDAPPSMDDLLSKIDPDKRLEESSNEIRKLKLDLGLERTFTKLGAKPGVTRAYMIDNGAMAQLDPLSK